MAYRMVRLPMILNDAASERCCYGGHDFKSESGEIKAEDVMT